MFLASSLKAGLILQISNTVSLLMFDLTAWLQEYHPIYLLHSAAHFLKQNSALHLPDTSYTY